MSDMAKALIRRHLELDAAGDWEALCEGGDGAVSYFVPGYQDESLTRRDDVLTMLAATEVPTRPCNLEILALVANESVGCAEIVLTGRLDRDTDGMPGSGAAVRVTSLRVYECADGRITGVAVYGDRRQALRQLHFTEEIVASASPNTG
jgi:ketosteroid isomerase-like protein